MRPAAMTVVRTLTILALVAAGVSVPGSAVAVDDGTISGRVTSAAHPGGLAGVTVSLEATVPPVVRASATTGPDGSYTFGGLHAGPYWIELVDPTGTHGKVATEVTVGPSQAATYDVRMVALGHITGRVTGPGGVAVAGARVMPYRADPDAEGMFSAQPVTTDAAGHYDLALPADGYQLHFTHPDPSTYRWEFWDDAYSREDAATITVAEGAVRSGVDVALGLSGRISGTVDAPRGFQPQVQPYRWHPERRAWEVVGYGTGVRHHLFELTDLPAGTYRLAIRDNSFPFAPTVYWEGATSLAKATSFDLKPGETRTGFHLVAEKLSSVHLTASPRVSGKAKAGATLRVSSGSWTPNAATVTVTVQWYAGRKAIPRATRPSLKLSGKPLKAVRGKLISVRVTAIAPDHAPLTVSLVVRGRIRR